VPARRSGLGTRFVVGCCLLVATSAAASAWTLRALAQLAAVVGRTVAGIDEAAAATTSVSEALEREDDALLLTLTEVSRGRHALVGRRASVDAAVATLLAQGDVLALPATAHLRENIEVYRRAADRIVDDRRGPDRLLRYYRESNPLLQTAVGQVTAIREQFFTEAQRMNSVARGELVSTRGAVLLISCVSLIVALVTAFHLVRSVVRPLRRIILGVVAMKEGKFDERLPVDFRDELGEVALALNDMAARLAELRRLNVGEVIRAKALLEATLGALPDAVVLMDQDGNVISLNAAAEKLLVTTDKRPRRAEDIVIEGFDSDDVARFLDQPTGAQPVVDLSSALKIERGGKLIRLLPRLLPLPGLADRRPGAILVLYDVTELAQLDERRGELVSIASHELQTPLTTLHMTLRMLHEDEKWLSHRQRQLVDTALVGIGQLDETVNEYLDLTRIEAGQLQLRWDLVDPIAIVERAVERAQAATGMSGARITLTHGPETPMLWGDATRIRLVIDNVLSNAVKYTPAGGLIDVTVQRVPGRDDAIQIAVGDQGPGVPEEFRTRIFDKFFRVEHQLPRGDRGLRGFGIGLHLARQIVERHGGRIECQARPRGTGAHMLIEFPRDGRDARGAPDA
jgi:NtrC-family two-component system sensor histidine kinase KinB